jgi:hypothetical protein
MSAVIFLKPKLGEICIRLENNRKEFQIRKDLGFCNVISFCFSFLLGLALSVSPAGGVF